MRPFAFVASAIFVACILHGVALAEDNTVSAIPTEMPQNSASDLESRSYPLKKSVLADDTLGVSSQLSEHSIARTLPFRENMKLNVVYAEQLLATGNSESAFLILDRCARTLERVKDFGQLAVLERTHGRILHNMNKPYRAISHFDRYIMLQGLFERTEPSYPAILREIMQTYWSASQYDSLVSWIKGFEAIAHSDFAASAEIGLVRFYEGAALLELLDQEQNQRTRLLEGLPYPDNSKEALAMRALDNLIQANVSLSDGPEHEMLTSYIDRARQKVDTATELVPVSLSDLPRPRTRFAFLLVLGLFALTAVTIYGMGRCKSFLFGSSRRGCDPEIVSDETRIDDPGWSVYSNDPVTRVIVDKFNLGCIQMFVLIFLLGFGGFFVTTFAEGTAFQVPEVTQTFLRAYADIANTAVLCPLILVFAVLLYRKIPPSFDRLFAMVMKGATKRGKEEQTKARVTSLRNQMISAFEYRWTAPVVLAVAALGGGFGSGSKWFTLSIYGYMEGRPTVAGLYMVAFVILLVYLILMALVKWGIAIWGLTRAFRDFEGLFDIEPLHPDRCAGLKFLGDMSLGFSKILSVIGIIVFLFVAMDITMHGKAVNLANILMVPSYLVLAPLAFFLPLYAAHKEMQRAKENRILAINNRFVELTHSFEKVDEIKALREEHQMAKREPIWPFDVETIGRFSGTVLLPIVLPFLLQLIIPFF
jgi:hypothetical protein